MTDHGRSADQGEQLAWIEGVLRGVDVHITQEHAATTLRELADTAARWRERVNRGPTLQQVRNMIRATAIDTGDDWRAQLWHAVGYLDEMIGDDHTSVHQLKTDEAAAYEAGRARAESMGRKGE